jgi:hypothetical protein
MPHGHGGPGENPEEIHAFVDSIINGGKPLPKITGQGRTDDSAWATFAGEAPVDKAELCYTKDAGKWQDRKWETAPAALDVAAGKITAAIPQGATVYYFNLTTSSGLIVSTQHEALGL